MQNEHDADEQLTKTEELLDHGRRFFYIMPHICRCDGCVADREQLIRELRPDILNIAKQWAKAPEPLIFKGLMEDWDHRQIAEVLGISLEKV